MRWEVCLDHGTVLPECVNVCIGEVHWGGVLGEGKTYTKASVNALGTNKRVKLKTR
jgi:hypothetical protein